MITLGSQINKVIGILVVLMYCGLGFFIYFSDAILVEMNPVYKKALGAIIFIYGIFRAFRFYKKQTIIEKDENQE